MQPLLTLLYVYTEFIYAVKDSPLCRLMAPGFHYDDDTDNMLTYEMREMFSPVFECVSRILPTENVANHLRLRTSFECWAGTFCRYPIFVIPTLRYRAIYGKPAILA